MPRALADLRLARESAVRELLALTLAQGQNGAQPLRERRRLLARLVRRLDEELERLEEEGPEARLERRRRVASSVSLTLDGRPSRLGAAGGRGGGRGAEHRVVAGR